MERDSRTATVLLVDDEAAVLVGVTQALSSAGLRVTSCSGGAAALEHLRTHHEIGVVVSDVRMPDIDGFELVRRVRSMQNDVPVLLISGDPRVGRDEDDTSTMGCSLLRKPFTRQELLDTVECLLSSSLVANGSARRR